MRCSLPNELILKLNLNNKNNNKEMNKHLHVGETPVNLNLANYKMEGEPVIFQTRKLKDITGIFKDTQALEKMDMEQLAYKVQVWLPVTEGLKCGTLKAYVRF